MRKGDDIMGCGRALLCIIFPPLAVNASASALEPTPQMRGRGLRRGRELRLGL
jgi:hypothetical protein